MTTLPKAPAGITVVLEGTPQKGGTHPSVTVPLTPPSFKNESKQISWGTRQDNRRVNCDEPAGGLVILLASCFYASEIRVTCTQPGVGVGGGCTPSPLR